APSPAAPAGTSRGSGCARGRDRRRRGYVRPRPLLPLGRVLRARVVGCSYGMKILRHTGYDVRARESGRWALSGNSCLGSTDFYVVPLLVAIPMLTGM